MSNQPTPKYDVSKRQKYLFDACARNTLLANESIKMAQESMLALGLAELAFLGVLLLDKERPVNGAKTLVILLIFSFVLFLFGQIRQYKNQLRAARIFETKSNKALDYLAKETRYLDSEPEDISLSNKQIKSDNIANLCIFSSLIILLFVTMKTIFLVARL